jgi:hypothetical protein
MESYSFLDGDNCGMFYCAFGVCLFSSRKILLRSAIMRVSSFFLLTFSVSFDFDETLIYLCTRFSLSHCALS